MISKDKVFLLSLLFLVIVSCQSRKLTILDMISGSFLIEKVIKNGDDVTFDYYLEGQGITFGFDGSCSFPFLNENGLKWEFIESEPDNRRIILTREKGAFRREYSIKFKIDERNLLQMELTRENEYILVTKLLFYPRNHPDFIKELLDTGSPNPSKDVDPAIG